MIRRILPALVLSSVAGCLFPQQSAAKIQSCDPVRTILMLDRTTKWSTDGRASFNDGLRAILLQDYSDGRPLFGRLDVYEVKGSDFGYQFLSTFLIEPFPGDASEGTDHPTGGGITGWFRELLGAGPGRAELQKEEDEEERTREEAEDSTASREKALQGITVLSNTPAPDSPETSLGPMTVSLVNERCVKQASCTIFIFSDMIDKMSRKFLSDTVSDPAAAASAYATSLLQGAVGAGARPGGFNEKSPRLTFVIWGIGRDEHHGDYTLTAPQVARLTMFWNAFLRTIGAVEVRTGKEIPVNIPAQCN